MKFCVLAMLAVFVALGCKSSTDSGASGGSAAAVERPTVTDPIGFCARAQIVMLRRKKCFPEDTSLNMGLDELAALEASAPQAPYARRKVAAQCALILDGMVRAQQPKACPLDATDDELRELTAFLTAWYGERTPAPTTGNAALDALVVALAAQRDAACACKAVDCARTAITELTAQLKALPPEMPAGASDAVGRMSDEAARCKSKLALGR